VKALVLPLVLPLVSARGAAAAPPRVCFTAATEATNLIADDATATLCSNDKPVTCARVDLASGAWTAVATAPAVPTAAPGTFVVTQSATGVAVCRGDACTKLSVPAPGEGDPYLAAASSDGKRAVLASVGWKGARFFDVAADKQVTAVTLTADGGCLDTVAFVGAFVYLATNVCAGPGAEGKVYNWRGKVTATLDGVNPYAIAPVEVGGRYAVADIDGTAVAIIDGKTGTSQTVSVPRVDCEACSIGGGMPFNGALAKTPNGKLVMTSPKLAVVVDPATRRIEKSFRIPVCPEAGSGN
jgi:hypothetical protein